MHSHAHYFLCLLLGATMVLGCAATTQVREAAEFPQSLEVEGFRDVIVQTGGVYISGQPEASALEWLRDKGVKTVINLRTQAEMDNRERVPYDERDKVQELGMRYVHIPLGGPDTPYDRAALARFAEALESSPGKVLLHCTVAWRASHMWAAYLVEYRGMSLGAAIDHAKAVNFGTLPVEGLLGKELRIDIQD